MIWESVLECAFRFVGGRAFPSLKRVPVIERSAFESCHIDSIDLSHLPLKRIERKTFYGVKLPSCLEYIGESSFSNCRNITEIIIPDNVKYIDDFAFGMDPKYIMEQTLEKISMNPVTLGRGVFSQCSKLKHIDWGNRLKRIGSQCFYRCTELTDIELPVTTDSIFGSAFSYCSKLESVSNLENVRVLYPYAFYYCESLKSVTLGCEVIGDNAFSSCTGLTDVTLKDGVRIIEEGAFTQGVPLTSITIPASVDSIGGHAFSISCLAEIKVYAQTPPVMGDWHSNTVFSNYDAALYVPKGSLDAYRNAPEWKRFKYIEEMDNTDGIHNHSHNSINIDTIYDMQRLQKVSPHLYLTLPRPSASLRGRWESPRRFPGEWVRCRGSLCQHHGRGLTMYPTKCLPQS